MFLVALRRDTHVAALIHRPDGADFSKEMREEGKGETVEVRLLVFLVTTCTKTGPVTFNCSWLSGQIQNEDASGFFLRKQWPLSQKPQGLGPFEERLRRWWGCIGAVLLTGRQQGARY